LPKYVLQLSSCHPHIHKTNFIIKKDIFTMSFTLFPKLPAELRAIIWQFAGDIENQVIEYHWTAEPITEDDFTWRSFIHGIPGTYGSNERISSATRNLGALSACRESHKETIRHNPDHLDWKYEAWDTADAASVQGDPRA
jgi:hypothetical protein